MFCFFFGNLFWINEKKNDEMFRIVQPKFMTNIRTTRWQDLHKWNQVNDWLTDWLTWMNRRIFFPLATLVESILLYNRILAILFIIFIYLDIDIWSLNRFFFRFVCLLRTNNNNNNDKQQNIRCYGHNLNSNSILFNFGFLVLFLVAMQFVVFFLHDSRNKKFFFCIFIFGWFRT